LVAAAAFKRIFPVVGQAVPMASFIDLDAGGDRKAGYGEADKLPLAAAKATYGVPHQEDFGEVLGAEAGAAEALAGAVLTSDGGTVLRIDPEEWLTFVGRTAPVAGAIAAIGAEFHLQLLLSSGRSGRSKSFCGALREMLGVRGARMG
jgi:hypothetical protein